MLAEDGKKNSLGRAEEVVQLVLADQDRLSELYECLFDQDAWVRMRALSMRSKKCVACSPNGLSHISIVYWGKWPQ